MENITFVTKVEPLVYTAKELREALKISTTTLWRLEKTGRLTSLPGVRHKLYPKKAVEKFLASATPQFA